MDPQGVPQGINIGPPYFGNTLQLNLDVVPTSVEVVGEVIEESGTYRCTENGALFSRYQEAIEQWKTALGKITIAPAGSLGRIAPRPNPLNNVTPVNRKR
jgi:hypothetical protein